MFAAKAWELCTSRFARFDVGATRERRLTKELRPVIARPPAFDGQVFFTFPLKPILVGMRKRRRWTSMPTAAVAAVRANGPQRRAPMTRCGIASSTAGSTSSSRSNPSLTAIAPKLRSVEFSCKIEHREDLCLPAKSFGMSGLHIVARCASSDPARASEISRAREVGEPKDSGRIPSDINSSSSVSIVSRRLTGMFASASSCASSSRNFSSSGVSLRVISVS